MSAHAPIIIGAGPAGLTAALAMLDRGDGSRPVVLEATDTIGGISRTVVHGGNRIDIGGHRFFSKSQEVNDIWQRMMPLQGAPALDDRLIGASPIDLDPAGPDPDAADRVMLDRRRVSRIYYRRSFFDYPVSLSMATLRGLGLGNTLRAGLGYLKSRVAPLPETSLENFYVNRFGRPLYGMFFEDYTTKVWGVHPSQLGADWGSQRVKGLSVTAILRDVALRALHIKDAKKETSLIERFRYPKLGPGQLWETMAADVTARGAQVVMNAPVVEVRVGPDRRVQSVTTADGQMRPCTSVFSSMPIKDLVAALRGVDVPADVARAAAELPYRDFITVGLLVPELKIRNRTRLATFAGRVPDTWIYIQEPDVRAGRLQVFNNWSPYMVADYRSTTWIGLEYFCFEGDELWSMPDSALASMAAAEMVKIGILDPAAPVLDSTVIRMPKAYPAYYGSYAQLPAVREFLDSIGGLYCIGRNGQHRYNNMDHSMLTALEAVRCAASGSPSRAAVWNVNTEKDYHEQSGSQA